MKSHTPFPTIVLWVLALAGCGSSPPPEPVPDASVASDAGVGTDGGPIPECSAEDWRTACPARPCEDLTGCIAGACQYSDFICDGNACPPERCEATPNGDGTFANACVPAADTLACDDCPSGRCVCGGGECIDARPIRGGLVSATHSGLGDVRGSRLELFGSLSLSTHQTPAHCNGGACVSGGINP